MRKMALSALLLSSFAVSSCVKSIMVRPPPYAAPASTCADAPSDLEVVTFNTGLGPGIVRYSSARAPRVIDAVASTPFDVMCLQEVWTDGDRDAIVQRLGLPPENVAYARTAGLGETESDRCESPHMLDRLVACTQEKCAGVSDEDMTMCALSQCRSALTRIFFQDRNCLNCLAAMAGHGTADIQRQCAGPGLSRIYGGRNGIILASRWPLKDREAVMLPASNANRVALFARVEIPGRGDVEVACSHLSATQDILPYHSGYSDWDEEKAAQLVVISRRLQERAAGRPQLFIGDQNFGGTDGTVEEESGAVWYMAHELGFSDPVAYARPSLCSICPANTFVGDGRRGSLIDHVLLRDPPGGLTVTPTCAQRVFDRPVDIIGYDGASVSTSLSDHFGIRAKFILR